MSELEDIEIQLLLEGVFRYYGFDFRNYAPASLKRRIWKIIRLEHLTSISGLQEKILHGSHLSGAIPPRTLCQRHRYVPRT